ncbi:hypothetical protein K438DRAFT_1775335 [Mycena galopus ATCC 62051]|nr:hypothetical protein K438DRAFT_1775335 [Mycena galopus ATCC 62051]
MQSPKHGFKDVSRRGYLKVALENFNSKGGGFVGARVNEPNECVLVYRQGMYRLVRDPSRAMAKRSRGKTNLTKMAEDARGRQTRRCSDSLVRVRTRAWVWCSVGFLAGATLNLGSLSSRTENSDRSQVGEVSLTGRKADGEGQGLPGGNGKHEVGAINEHKAEMVGGGESIEGRRTRFGQQFGQKLEDAEGEEERRTKDVSEEMDVSETSMSAPRARMGREEGWIRRNTSPATPRQPALETERAGGKGIGGANTSVEAVCGSSSSALGEEGDRQNRVAHNYKPTPNASKPAFIMPHHVPSEREELDEDRRARGREPPRGVVRRLDRLRDEKREDPIIILVARRRKAIARAFKGPIVQNKEAEDNGGWSDWKCVSCAGNLAFGSQIPMIQSVPNWLGRAFNLPTWGPKYLPLTPILLHGQQIASSKWGTMPSRPDILGVDLNLSLAAMSA